ncbi:MAG: YheT family hydrolase [Steroidobacteraceae bacterium]
MVFDLRPSTLLRSGHLQSLLSSLPPFTRLARRRAAAMLAVAQPLELACGQGVRLQGYYSRGRGARVAVLLHGWEGSSQSTCVLSLAAQLYEGGYDVLRLNLRDHGGSHLLNREIFHSCRLPEVVGALQAIARRFDATPLYLAGFSLGGNFLLRAGADAGLPAAVRGVVAISPVLEPAATLLALERGMPLYRRNLVRRWSRSLRAKQRAWPEVHDFSKLLRLADLRRMTAGLVRSHTEFADLDAYLRGYAITGQRLAQLYTRCSLLVADDDPLIPVADLQRLSFSAQLTVWRSRYGGHCGFMRRVGLPTAADRFVLEQFDALG